MPAATGAGRGGSVSMGTVASKGAGPVLSVSIGIFQGSRMGSGLSMSTTKQEELEVILSFAGL
jgi:hypothetical protein